MTSLIQLITLTGLVRLQLAKAVVISLKHVPVNEQSNGGSEMIENVKTDSGRGPNNTKYVKND